MSETTDIESDTLDSELHNLPKEENELTTETSSDSDVEMSEMSDALIPNIPGIPALIGMSY
ncbi:MAG: hypothetical protein QG561_822 [Patescibacteria group bacterium]|jgi:hypothetical protein|nr:hypothetical protein [Patescibacteria group bacterium]